MTPPPTDDDAMNRADAYALMTEHTKDPSLVKHMLAVEAVRQD